MLEVALLIIISGLLPAELQIAFEKHGALPAASQRKLPPRQMKRKTTTLAKLMESAEKHFKRCFRGCVVLERNYKAKSARADLKRVTAIINLRSAQIITRCFFLIPAVLMHYFFLAAFFWLNAMCFNIWWTFRWVFLYPFFSGGAQGHAPRQDLSAASTHLHCCPPSKVKCKETPIVFLNAEASTQCTYVLPETFEWRWRP